MRTRGILVSIAIAAAAFAVTAVGCTTSSSSDSAGVDAGLPSSDGGHDGGDAAIAMGVTPADGGGYCCLADNPINCEPGFLGGWKLRAEECPLDHDSNGDSLYMEGIDDHGCVYFYLYTSCSCLGPACFPDASTDASNDAADASDAGAE